MFIILIINQICFNSISFIVKFRTLIKFIVVNYENFHRFVLIMLIILIVLFKYFIEWNFNLLASLQVLIRFSIPMDDIDSFTDID